VHDGLEVQLLRRDQREAMAEVETHLPAERGEGAGAGSVGLASAVLQHVAHQVEVLAHGSGVVAGRLAAPVRDGEQPAPGDDHRQRQDLAHRQPVEQQVAAVVVRTRTNSTAKRNTP